MLGSIFLSMSVTIVFECDGRYRVVIRTGRLYLFAYRLLSYAKCGESFSEDWQYGRNFFKK